MTTRARWIAVTLALAGATCLALAVGRGTWWSVGEAVSIGPRGTVTCLGGDCRGTGFDWLGGSELWRQSGVATVAACLLAALALVALAGALAARRAGRLAAGVTVTATLTAAVAGAVFVLAFPDGAVAEATLGRGAALWLGGVIVAIAAATVVLRAPREARA